MMKHFILAILASIMMFGFAGVSSAADIAGEWVAYQEEDASRGEKIEMLGSMYVTFNADGTTPRPTQNGQTKTYTWKVVGDTLTTYDEDGDADEVYKIVGDELKITVNQTRVISFRKAEK